MFFKNAVKLFIGESFWPMQDILSENFPQGRIYRPITGGSSLGIDIFSVNVGLPAFWLPATPLVQRLTGDL